MLKDGFTAEEVAAAKTGYLQSRQVSRAQDNELAGRLNNYLFLDRTLKWDADARSNKIKALTPEQINAAMRRHINRPAMIRSSRRGTSARSAEVKCRTAGDIRLPFVPCPLTSIRPTSQSAWPPPVASHLRTFR